MEQVSKDAMEAWRQRALRAELGLELIRGECERASFGGWRHKVAAIVDQALRRAP